MNRLTKSQLQLLAILSSYIKNEKLNSINVDSFTMLFEESISQSVFPMVFDVTKKLMPKDVLIKYNKVYFAYLEYAALSFQNHATLCKILVDEPEFVIIKGVASANYYRDPYLRSMGDVDFLVNLDKVFKIESILKQNGFIKKDTDNSHPFHAAYVINNSLQVFEMHYRINARKNKTNLEIINSWFSDIYDSRNLCKVDEGDIIVPSDFHHGLILLMHFIQHLTAEGIGLRHVVDWCVFLDNIGLNQFMILYEEKLKLVGLWKFTLVLTAICVKYLGRSSFSSIICDNDYDIVEELLIDIFDSGNFAKKNSDRYRQIKYLNLSEV